MMYDEALVRSFMIASTVDPVVEHSTARALGWKPSVGDRVYVASGLEGVVIEGERERIPGMYFVRLTDGDNVSCSDKRLCPWVEGPAQ